MNLSLQGVDYRPGKNQNEIWLCCPFCVQRGQTPDTRYRLGVNLVDGKSHCFNCEWKSTGQKTFDLLAAYIHLNMSPIDIEEDDTRITQKKAARLPEGFIPLYHGPDDELGFAAYSYLRGRGVTHEQIHIKQIGYCISGEYAYRVVFPVWNRKRKLSGFVARDWTGKQTLRYKNSETGIKETLYNAHLLNYFVKRGIPPVLVEGVLDCLSVDRAGFASCGLLGRAMTELQEKELGGANCLCLLLDWDADGIKTGLETAATLSSSTRHVFVALPVQGKKDAGEMGREEIQQCVNAARPYTSGLRQEITIRFKKEARL